MIVELRLKKVAKVDLKVFVLLTSCDSNSAAPRIREPKVSPEVDWKVLNENLVVDSFWRIKVYEFMKTFRFLRMNKICHSNGMELSFPWSIIATASSKKLFFSL